MKKILTSIVLLSICADISNAAYKSYGSRTSKSASISKPYRSTSSSHTSQSDLAQSKKSSYYRAIPSREPNIVVKKEDNFFWGMFWGAVLFSDHGKTTHVTNEIKQQVATENQELWDEYQQNLEAIKSGDGDTATLKARNKEILSIFKQKATEKYIAQFSIDAKEVSSVLLEEKNVTGASGYTDASFGASLFGATHGKPIVETRTYKRYEKVFQVNLTGPKPLKDFKVEAVDPNKVTIEQNASGVCARHKQEFGTYPIDVRFTNKTDKSLSFVRSFETGGGNIGELAPLPSDESIEAKMNGVADIFHVNDIGELYYYIMAFTIFVLVGRYLIKETGVFSDVPNKTAYLRVPTNVGDLKQMEIDLAKSLNEERSGDLSSDRRSAVKTAKIHQDYYMNKKYRAGR